MAPIEAMVIGCPTIFTRRAAGNEIINEGCDGLLIDPDYLNEITDVIISMLTNRKSALQMGKNGAKEK